MARSCVRKCFEPDCLPSGAVAQEARLIPVSGHVVGVVGGARNGMMRRCQERREVFCETCCEME